MGIHLNQFMGSSSSIGDKRVRNVCVAFRAASEQNNRAGCLRALEVLEQEYCYLESKMHELFQVMFPSTLLETGENWTLMKTISVTEYLNYEAGKFSKSKGIRVFGNDAKDTNIPVEVWRYYLLTNRPEVSDTLLPGPIYKQNSTVSCSVIWATLSIEFRALLLNLQAQDMVQLFQMLLLLTHIH
ncbi:probable methionine--tRNA ligase, cytoplasmic isoform X3 [Euphorbia lathyris]